MHGKHRDSTAAYILLVFIIKITNKVINKGSRWPQKEAKEREKEIKAKQGYKINVKSSPRSQKVCISSSYLAYKGST